MTETIRVWVKGGPKDARQAAELHGLTYEHERTVPDNGWAIGLVTGERADVVRWYAESPNRSPPDGYLPGVLLLHC